MGLLAAICLFSALAIIVPLIPERPKSDEMPEWGRGMRALQKSIDKVR